MGNRQLEAWEESKSLYFLICCRLADSRPATQLYHLRGAIPALWPESSAPGPWKGDCCCWATSACPGGCLLHRARMERGWQRASVRRLTSSTCQWGRAYWQGKGKESNCDFFPRFHWALLPSLPSTPRYKGTSHNLGQEESPTQSPITPHTSLHFVFA